MRWNGKDFVQKWWYLRCDRSLQSLNSVCSCSTRCFSYLRTTTFLIALQILLKIKHVCQLFGLWRQHHTGCCPEFENISRVWGARFCWLKTDIPEFIYITNHSLVTDFDCSIDDRGMESQGDYVFRLIVNDRDYIDLISENHILNIFN